MSTSRVRKYALASLSIVSIVALLTGCTQTTPVKPANSELKATMVESLSSQLRGIGELANDSNWFIEEITFEQCSFPGSGVDDEEALVYSQPQMEAWGILQEGSATAMLDEYYSVLTRAGYNVANPVLDSKSLDDNSKVITLKADSKAGRNIMISIDENLTIHSVITLPCGRYDVTADIIEGNKKTEANEK